MIEIEPIESDDDVMTIEEFKDAVKIGFLTDYDGHGVWATSTHKTNQYVNPSDDLSNPPADMTHVVWYNK